MNPTPESYGEYLSTALTLARTHGMDAATDFIAFELSEQEAKTVLAHVVNCIIEDEKCQIFPS